MPRIMVPSSEKICLHQDLYQSRTTLHQFGAGDFFGPYRWGVTNSQGLPAGAGNFPETGIFLSFLFSICTVQHHRILFFYSFLEVGLEWKNVYFWFILNLRKSSFGTLTLWRKISYHTCHLCQNLDFNFWTCGPWVSIKNKKQVPLVGRCPQRQKQCQCSVFPLDSHIV